MELPTPFCLADPDGPNLSAAFLIALGYLRAEPLHEPQPLVADGADRDLLAFRLVELSGAIRQAQDRILATAPGHWWRPRGTW